MILLPAIVMGSCVSKKKYDELLMSHNRLETKTAVESAKEEGEQSESERLLEEMRLMRERLAQSEMAMQKFQMMRDASDIPQPTPEQMEAYNLMYHEKMQELNEAQSQQEKDELKYLFQQTQYGNALVLKSMKAALADYKSSQVTFTQHSGMVVVGIQINELFDANNSELSMGGKLMLDKVHIALQNQRPYYLRIQGVTESGKTGRLDLSALRAVAVHDYLVSGSPSMQQPKLVGAVECDNIAGNKVEGCEQIELIFEQNYDVLMPMLEQTIH